MACTMTSTLSHPSSRIAMSAWLLALTLTTACTGDEPSDDAGLETSASEGTNAAADTSGSEAESSDASTSTTPDPGTTDSGDDPSTGDPGEAELGAIAGSITRTAEPTDGGLGTVYVAVFAENPITNMQAPTLGQDVLEGSDLTDPTAVLTYVIDGLPARDEPYHVVAFLDDDANASMDAPGPDMGDLVTLDGTGTPTVVVTPGDPVPMNLVLNAVMPF